MLDKNGLPLQFPTSAFPGFPLAGFDPRTGPWPHHQPYNSASQHGLSQTSGSGMGLGDAGAAALLGLPPPHPLSPTYLNALRHHTSPSHSLRFGERLPTHQDYLNAAAQRLGELQANAAFQANAAAAAVSDQLNSLESARLGRTNRKRALSASPYPELDLSALVRYSPTSLHFLSGSPGSSGSYGHLSTGTLSPALVHSAHLQQLHAHLLRSAAASPFLSPQNSLQNSLLQLSAAAALHQAPLSSGPTYLPLVNASSGISTDQSHTTLPADKNDLFTKGCKESPRPKELCSNVVSSTMKDEESKEDLLVPQMDCMDQSRSHLSKPTFSTRPDHQHSMKELDIKDEPDFIETHCHWIGCDKDFGTQDELVRHLGNDHIGSNKKSFVCQWKDCCREEKPFKAQYMLVVHMRRHTGEKPHRCSFENCNKAYSRLENLKTHLRSHTGEKPYSCEFPGCTKAFSNASDRAKHQNRTHSNEKPYACRAPGCTKRYTDPSSLRKHVKTVHGAEFYANKRHKGMNNPDDRSEDGSSWCQLNTPRTPHSVSTTKSDAANSPSPSSPPQDRSGHASAQGPNVPTTAVRRHMQRQPLSDTDVSTTHHEMLPGWNNETIDFTSVNQVGIGVNLDEYDCGPPQSFPNASHRMALKMKSNLASPAILGDINRSIEKLSIGGSRGSGRPGKSTQNAPLSSYNNQSMCQGNNMGGQPISSQGMTVLNNTNARRDSNWTNSTEGYGSMRSEQSMVSRRCSDVSAMSAISVGSNVSMRAQMNSPWDPISAESSRRSSLVGHDASMANVNQNVMSQHLNKLHRKSQNIQQQQTSSPTPTQFNKQLSCLPTNHTQGQPLQVRRASDPVRVLDRNFGVTNGEFGRNQRSGSFNQLNSITCNSMQQRVPIHGQRIRGMDSENNAQSYYQTSNTLQHTSYNQPNGNSQPVSCQPQQYNQQNSQMASQFNQQGMWAQQQGNYDYYNGTHGNGHQFNNSQYPSGASDASNWNAQNWTSWQPQTQAMQQQSIPQTIPSNVPNGSTNGVKQCDSFQRTFDYVQQCQGWNGQQ